MPAYNAETFIEESIKSVLSQSYTNWELIIIDDGSTDSTSKIVNHYKLYDSRIIYVYQENKKQGGARNYGIRIAKGDWIAFLDADDIWLPEKLITNVKYIQQYNYNVFYSGGFIIYQDSTNIENYKTIYGFNDGDSMLNILYDTNVIPILSTIVDINWIRKVGFQDESISIAGCEDWDYWLKLSKSGATFYGIDKQLFLYRSHPAGSSKRSQKMQVAQVLVMLNNFDYKLKNADNIISRLINVVEPLTVSLIQSNSTIEAVEIMSKAYQVLNIYSYKINYYLITKLGKRSHYLVRLFNKLNFLTI